ncbi:MAG TPA: MltA domain-containing protein, partial [Phenylobacterium sp.]
MQLRAVGAAVSALILAACATTPPSSPIPNSPARHPAPSPLAAEPSPPRAEARIPLSALKGWEADDHAAALAAFRGTCGAARNPAMAEVCRSARAIGPLDREQSRRFFEANFRAEASPGAGVLTAYFAPEYPARRKPDAEFSAALRSKPADLRTVDAGMFDPAQAGRPGAARDA